LGGGGFELPAKGAERFFWPTEKNEFGRINRMVHSPAMAAASCSPFAHLTWNRRRTIQENSRAKTRLEKDEVLRRDEQTLGD
jgi:hypothetical protein